jgi:hypothetical protein
VAQEHPVLELAAATAFVTPPILSAFVSTICSLVRLFGLTVSFVGFKTASPE